MMFKLKFRHAVAGLDICVVSLGWWSVVRLIWLNRVGLYAIHLESRQACF